MEGAAAAVNFYCDGIFNPEVSSRTGAAKYCEARVIQFEYNTASVVAHLTWAMNLARAEQLRLRPEDDARPGVPTKWSEFVYVTVDEAGHRRAKSGSSATYTAKELAELRHDIGAVLVRMEAQNAATAAYYPRRIQPGGKDAARHDVCNTRRGDTTRNRALGQCTVRRDVDSGCHRSTL